jgi:hypothetical protein
LAKSDIKDCFTKLKSFPTDLEIWRSNHRTKRGSENSEVPQSNVCSKGSVLYLPYADFPVVLGFTIAIYADDRTVLMAHNNHIEVSCRQESLFYIQRWLKNGKLKLTEQNQYM